jgi:hypothetical protein
VVDFMSYSKPLSYSSLSLWKKCPAQWEWKYILGHFDPPGRAADRGTELHDTIETFYTYPESSLPQRDPFWRPWAPLLQGLRPHAPVAEGEVAVNDQWAPVSYKDPSAMYRGKLDLSLNAGKTRFILDWKSGRIYDEHHQQGKDYVALSPDGFDNYVVYFVYLDQPTIIHRWEYSAEDRVALQQDVTERVLEVRSAKHYPFNKGDHCRWCSRSKNKGGNCPHA